jgi:hypothetical protein
MGLKGNEAEGSMATLMLFALGAAALGGGAYVLVGAPGAPLASGGGDDGPGDSDDGPKDGDFRPIFGPVVCLLPPNGQSARCSWTFEAKAGNSTLIAHDERVVAGEVALNGAVVLDSAGLAGRDGHKAPVVLLDGANTVDIAIRAEKGSGIKLFIGEGDGHDRPRPIAEGKCWLASGDPMPKTCDFVFKSPQDHGILVVDYTFGRKAAKGADLDSKEYAVISLNGVVVADYADFPPPAGHFDKPARLNVGENKATVEICCTEGAAVGFHILAQTPPPPPHDKPLLVAGCEQSASNPDPVRCDFAFRSPDEAGVIAVQQRGPALGAISINGDEVLQLKGPGELKIEVKLNPGDNRLQVRMDPNAAGDAAVQLEIWAGDVPPPPGPRPLFAGECYLDEKAAGPAVCRVEFKSDVNAGVVLLRWKGVTHGAVALNGKVLVDAWKEPSGELKVAVGLMDLNSGEMIVKATGPAGIYMEVFAA